MEGQTKNEKERRIWGAEQLFKRGVFCENLKKTESDFVKILMFKNMEDRKAEKVLAFSRGFVL